MSCNILPDMFVMDLATQLFFEENKFTFRESFPEYSILKYD